MKSKDAIELDDFDALDGVVEIEIIPPEPEKSLDDVVNDLDAQFDAWDRGSKDKKSKVAIKYNWDFIEYLNKGLNVTRDNCHVDDRGYLRWNDSNRLVHRDVAYNEIYLKSGRYPMKFKMYEIHHINKNKFDNQPENLQILTRRYHQNEHS